MTINPARIGTSEAELRRVYASAKARLYSAPEASAQAERIREERNSARVANEKLAAAIEDLLAEREALRKKIEEREEAALRVALLEAPSKDAVELGRLIVRNVARRHGLSQADIEDIGRTKGVCSARHQARYELADKTALSLTRIAKLTGGKDHTTALHSIRTFAKRNSLPLPREMTP